MKYLFVFFLSWGLCFGQIERLDDKFDGSGNITFITNSFDGSGNVIDLGATSADYSMMWLPGSGRYDAVVFDSGLVAAYNMVPDGSTLPDISGGGRYANNTNTIKVPNGLSYNGINSSSTLVSSTASYSAATIICRLKLNNSVMGNLNAFSSNLTSDAFYYVTFNRNSAGNIAWYEGTTYKEVYTGDLRGSEVTCAFIFNNGTYKVYVDGVQTYEATTGTFTDASLQYIGSQRNIARHFDGEIYDLRLYNRELSSEEVSDYHNSFSSGTRTEEWNLQCITAGTASKQSTQAYGEWEFDVLKNGDNNQTNIHFINSNQDVFPTSGLGYRFAITVNESVNMLRMDGGSNILILWTSLNSYVTTNTWYSNKINRTSSGLLHDSIKGGILGSDYILLNAIGNPLTDNTYTTSFYKVLDFDANDQYSDSDTRAGIGLYFTASLLDAYLKDLVKYYKANPPTEDLTLNMLGNRFPVPNNGDENIYILQLENIFSSNDPQYLFTALINQ